MNYRQCIVLVADDDNVVAGVDIDPTFGGSGVSGFKLHIN